MTDNYDVYNTQNFDIGELIKRSRVPHREEDEPSENKMPPIKVENSGKRIVSQWVYTQEDAAKGASKILGTFAGVSVPIPNDGKFHQVELYGNADNIKVTIDGEADPLAEIANHDHNGYLPNTWEIRLSKALNFISHDEKWQLWNDWGKTKFGAIYVMRTQFDLERVIGLGKIPNAPQDAVYISSSYDYDTDRFLVKAWSKELYKIAEGECYHRYDVEFFDGDPDCKHERKCSSSGLSFDQSQCLGCGKIIEREINSDYVEGGIMVKLDWDKYSNLNLNFSPATEVHCEQLPNGIIKRYIEVSPEFLLDVARFSYLEVYKIMGDDLHSDWIKQKYPNMRQYVERDKGL